jgi:hypothetical protein
LLRKNKFVFLIFFQSVQQVCAAAHAGHTQWLKRYRAHDFKEKYCTFIENSAGRNDIFSKEPASA